MVLESDYRHCSGRRRNGGPIADGQEPLLKSKSIVHQDVPLEQ